MLRKKEERGNHSDGGVGCVLWPALGAGWMCDPGGQPSEQQQFTVAHNQPASQIPLSSSSRTRDDGPATDSGARLPRVTTLG